MTPAVHSEVRVFTQKNKINHKIYYIGEFPFFRKFGEMNANKITQCSHFQTITSMFDMKVCPCPYFMNNLLSLVNLTK